MNNETPEISEAVTLILKRMDSNPDEFLTEEYDPRTMMRNKWSAIVEQYASCLTEEERKLLKDKKATLRVQQARKDFHKAVLEALLVGEERGDNYLMETKYS